MISEGVAGSDSSCVCLHLGSHPLQPCPGRPSRSPQQPSASPRPPYPSPSSFSPTGFPPIPGLEPTTGTEEDAVAATLAAAQKLASEDTAPAEEDGDEDEVWLRAQDSRGWGEMADEGQTQILLPILTSPAK